MGNPRVQYAILRFVFCAIALLAMVGVVRADPPAPETPKSEAPAVRVAILNFGPTAEQLVKGPSCDTIGICIDVEDWRDAIAMLEKNKADVVVFAVNSAGGFVESVQPFHDLIEKEYKRRFRTVAWIESCVFQTALTVLPIEEFYFKPAGYFGWGMACWPPKESPEKVRARFEEQIRLTETGALLGKRDRLIPRSWILFQALSADIDPKSGAVTWRQDELGQVLVNREGRAGGFNSVNALQTRLSRGTASTREELAAALGIAKVEWVGKEANEFLKRRLEERSKKYDDASAAYANLIHNMDYAEGASDPKIAKEYVRRALPHFQALEAHADNSPRMFALVVGERSVLNDYRAKIKKIQDR